MQSLRHRVLMSIVAAVLGLMGCSEKELDPNNPARSYAYAKEPYDNRNFEIALNKLGEFKSRFPYSKHATEAELLIANSHFELGQFPEASVAYEQFIKLHPKHPQVPYAQFRVGESYWKEAPSEIDREQDLTSRAIIEWEKLLKKHPESEFAKNAQSLVMEGKKRIFEAEAFIANFYCKKEIWHSCAYRFVHLADKAPRNFKNLIKNALEKAGLAFEKMADDRTEANKDKNLYYRKMTNSQLKQQAAKLKFKAKSMG